MANTATAAAIGIKITAINDASKTMAKIAADMKSLGKLGADSDLNADGKLSGGLKKIASGFSKIRSSAGSALGALVDFTPGLGTLVAGASAAGLGKLVENFVVLGASTQRTAQQLGMPVQKLYQLQNAGRLAGVSVEGMTGGLLGLQNVMADAVYGRNNEAANTFRSLGIDIGNAQNGVRDMTKLLPTIADITQKMFKVSPHAAGGFLDRIGIGREMLPVLKDGRTALAGYMAEADKLGTLTEAQAQKARDLEHAQAALGIQFRTMGVELGSALTPALAKASKGLTAFFEGHQKGTENFFTTIGNGAVSLVTVAERVDKVTAAIGGLKTIVEALALGWLARKIFGFAAGGAVAGGVIAEAGLRAVDPKDTMGSAIDRNVPGAAFVDDWMARNTGLGRTYAEQQGGTPDAGSVPAAGQQRGFFERVNRWIHGYRHGPEVANPDQDKAAKESWDFWKKQGYGDAGAASRVATEKAESGFNPTAVGDRGDAGGSFQWHKDRRDALIAQTGIDVWQDQEHLTQLRAADLEMRRKIDPQAGAAYNTLMTTDSIRDAVAADVDGVERPGDRAGAKAARQALAEGYYRKFHGGGAGGPAAGAGAPTAGYAPMAPYGDAGPGQGNGRLAQVMIDMHHHNPPAGTRVTARSNDPAVVVGEPTVVRSMPATQNAPHDG